MSHKIAEYGYNAKGNVVKHKGDFGLDWEVMTAEQRKVRTDEMRENTRHNRIS